MISAVLSCSSIAVSSLSDPRLRGCGDFAGVRVDAGWSGTVRHLAEFKRSLLRVVAREAAVVGDEHVFGRAVKVRRLVDVIHCQQQGGRCALGGFEFHLDDERALLAGCGAGTDEIGSASCRERVGPYVFIWVV